MELSGLEHLQSGEEAEEAELLGDVVAGALPEGVARRVAPGGQFNSLWRISGPLFRPVLGPLLGMLSNRGYQTAQKRPKMLILKVHASNHLKCLVGPNFGPSFEP